MDSENIDNPAAPQDVSEDEVWQEEPQLKRRGDKKTWSKHVAKRRRDSGEAYVSVTTKKEVNARKPGPPCTCPRNCYTKVGVDNVKIIFNNYYKLGSHDDQSAYIVSRVQPCVGFIFIKHRRHTRTIT